MFVPWSKAKTLPQFVASLIDDNRTNSPEYIALVSFYGPDRVQELYEQSKIEPQEPKIRDVRKEASGEKDDDTSRT